MAEEIEKDFETIKREVSEKMCAARKLLEEADELANDKLHCTLFGADQLAFEDLQSTMEELGFVTRDEGWNSSGCYY